MSGCFRASRLCSSERKGSKLEVVTFSHSLSLLLSGSTRWASRLASGSVPTVHSISCFSHSSSLALSLILLTVLYSSCFSADPKRWLSLSYWHKNERVLDYDLSVEIAVWFISWWVYILFSITTLSKHIKANDIKCWVCLVPASIQDLITQSQKRLESLGSTWEKEVFIKNGKSQWLDSWVPHRWLGGLISMLTLHLAAESHDREYFNGSF